MSNTPEEQPIIHYHNHKLWGMAGGELEYISQKIEWRKIAGDGGRWCRVMVIRFTDHDLQAQSIEHDEIIDGKYYEIEFSLGD